jgi:hypothetical protein
MADTELDAFLGGSEPASAPEPQQAPPPPEPPEQDAPDEDEGDAAEPDQGDDTPPEPRPGERTVPLAALEKQRKNHQERAARLEGELAEVRRQFEEVKRAQQQQPQQQYQPPQPIDPTTHPEQFVERIQQVVLNERLNSSEMMLRREIGAEAVEAAIADFKQAAQSDPTLFPKLYQQPDPYGWLAKHVEVLRMQREIGDDPKAYREKLIAEERAKWEAEYSGTAQPAAPVSPAARMAPSLANARSAAPRSNGAWSGPTPLSDLFPNR